MKKIIVSIIFLCFKISLSAQVVTFSGYVVNQSNEVIPYASVFISTKPNIGTFTDEKGFFILKAGATDTLFISHVGYESMKLAVRDLKNQIVLKENTQILREFAITSNRNANYTIQKLGTYWKKSKISFYIQGSSNFILFIPNKIKYEGIIKKVYYKAQHKNKSRKYKKNNILLRVRIYANSNNPDIQKKDLLNKNVFIEMRQNQRNVSIDLEKYNIHFPKIGVFIGLDVMGYLDGEGKLIKESISECINNTLFKMTDADENKNTFYKNFSSEKWYAVSRLPLSSDTLVMINALFGVEVLFEE